MEDPSDEVRQSAYALLGDCAKYVFVQLEPLIGKILPVLLRQLDLESILDEDIESGFSVVNNACWSAGEIAIQAGADLSPFVAELFEGFCKIITNPGIPKGVTENAAIALGRLGYSCSTQLAPHLGQFAEEFLSLMDDVDPSDEKATALRGFVQVVEKNPQAMEKSLLHYFTTVARYRDLKLRSNAKTALHDDFLKTINIYRQMIPQFDQFISQLPREDQESLRSIYGL